MEKDLKDIKEVFATKKDIEKMVEDILSILETKLEATVRKVVDEKIT